MHCTQGRRRRGGRGCPDPHFFKPGGRPLRFLRCIFFFALKGINIKQSIKLRMLMEIILLKDEVYDTKANKGTLLRPYR